MFLPFLAVLGKEITGDANTKGSSKHTGIYCNYLFIDTFGRLFNMLLSFFLVSFAFVHFCLLGEASSATSVKDRYFRVRGV